VPDDEQHKKVCLYLKNYRCPLIFCSKASAGPHKTLFNNNEDIKFIRGAALQVPNNGDDINIGADTKGQEGDSQKEDEEEDEWELEMGWENERERQIKKEREREKEKERERMKEPQHQKYSRKRDTDGDDSKLITSYFYILNSYSKSDKDASPTKHSHKVTGTAPPLVSPRKTRAPDAASKQQT
jgi:hypothetical protein